jgi:hypothetical protein
MPLNSPPPYKRKKVWLIVFLAMSLPQNVWAAIVLPRVTDDFCAAPFLPTSTFQVKAVQDG